MKPNAPGRPVIAGQFVTLVFGLFLMLRVFETNSEVLVPFFVFWPSPVHFLTKLAGIPKLRAVFGRKWPKTDEGPRPKNELINSKFGAKIKLRSFKYVDLHGHWCRQR